MLDPKFILSNAEAVRQNCRNRNSPPEVFDSLDWLITNYEHNWKPKLQMVEGFRRRQNEVAQATGREKDSSLRAKLIEEGKRLKAELAGHEEAIKQLELQLK